jgi:hypothetical protein
LLPKYAQFSFAPFSFDVVHALDPRAHASSRHADTRPWQSAKAPAFVVPTADGLRAARTSRTLAHAVTFLYLIYIIQFLVAEQYPYAEVRILRRAGEASNDGRRAATLVSGDN